MTSAPAPSLIEDFDRLQAKRRAAAEGRIDFWCRLWGLCHLIAIPFFLGSVGIIKDEGVASLLRDTDSATLVSLYRLASLTTAGRAAVLTIGYWCTISRRWRCLGLAPWAVLVAEVGVAATVVLLRL